MSKLLLKGNASGTGTITLETPNTNTDQTITLPNSTATLIAVSPGTAGNVLTSSGTAWTSAAAAAFDAGTRMMFAQDTAPTGWTKDTTNYNEHAIRIVTGTAGTTGGSVNFSTAFASQAVAGTVGSYTLTTSDIPSHSHTFTAYAGSVSPYGPGQGATTNPTTSTQTTDSTGGGGSHSHSFTGTAINLAVKYLNVITATKN